MVAAMKEAKEIMEGLGHSPEEIREVIALIIQEYSAKHEAKKGREANKVAEPTSNYGSEGKQ